MQILAMALWPFMNELDARQTVNIAVMAGIRPELMKNCNPHMPQSIEYRCLDSSACSLS